MKFIYYPDHAERYAHIPERERHQYPDEVHFHHWTVKRTKLLSELVHEDLGGVDAYLLARDIPIRKAMIH